MTLLDAYALIAFLAGGPAASQVRAILREGNVGVTTVNLVEILDVSRRVHGLAIERSAAVLEPLLAGPISVIPLGVEIAVRAGRLRATHYSRSVRPISLADAVLIASAGRADRIATADPDVLAVARAEELGTVALPPQG